MILAYAQKPSSLSDFVLHAGAKSCTGTEGLTNLLKLFRRDVKEILTGFNITEPSDKWRELQALIEPYRKDWTAFSMTDGCPMPEGQLDVIEYCRKYDDLSLLAKDKGYSHNSTSETFKTAVKRLKYPNFISDYFAKWKELRIKQGYTSYEDFAIEKDLNRAQYGRYERAKKDLRASSMIEIVEAFDMTLSKFFSEGFD